MPVVTCISGSPPRSFKFTRRTSLKLLLTVIFTLTVLSTFLPSPLLLKHRKSSSQGCPPTSYTNGSWVYNPQNATRMQKKDDALLFSGFEGCASSREYYWHLAADKEDQWDRFPRAHSYEWVVNPGQGQCDDDFGPIDPETIVKHLVEDGGWLLVGDSVTENHFFSLSCLLYPHVIATPKYTEGGSFDRGWPQNLYLNPSSPLLQHISFPDGFNITSTPLVTFRRIDLLFSQAELLNIHRSNNPSPQGFKLFSDEPVWTLPLASYLELFTTPLPLGNYATIVVSTAGHWTTSLFSGYHDEDKADAGYGIDPGLLSFFKEAMGDFP